MVKDTILYDRLGLKPGCSSSELKKAYFKLSKKWHPDKNNNSKESTEKFQEIAEAYEILRDDKKREMYHQVGIDILNHGAEGGGMGGIDPNDIFRNFFGGMGGGFNPFGNSRQRPVDEIEQDIHQKLFVSLEDIYKGNKVKVSYKRKIFCKDCDGTGSKDKKKYICEECNGKGQKVQVIRMGPMIQKAVQTCIKCNGTGRSCKLENQCFKCNGKSFTVKDETLDIPLRTGISEGVKMQVEGKGNVTKNKKSNLILHIVEKEHNDFKRKDNDLITELNISLAESIIGFEKYIKFLDGSNKRIKFSEGLSIGDGDVKMIKGLGMKDSYGKIGNLIIKFNVTPIDINKLSSKQKSKLANILGHKERKLNGEAHQVIEYVQQRRSRRTANVEGPGDCVQQ